MTIWTASWAAKLPIGHTRVRISRGGPRWLPAGSYKSYSAFFPGKWFKSVSPQEYLDRYNTMLAKLDPKRVVDELEALGPNSTMLCFEAAKDIEAGKCYCHRHVAAQWLEDTLGIKVEEVGHPDLFRFRYLNEEHVAAPSYARRERVAFSHNVTAPLRLARASG
jgi:hypothetical protein